MTLDLATWRSVRPELLGSRPDCSGFRRGWEKRAGDSDLNDSCKELCLPLGGSWKERWGRGNFLWGEGKSNWVA